MLLQTHMTGVRRRHTFMGTTSPARRLSERRTELQMRAHRCHRRVQTGRQRSDDHLCKPRLPLQAAGLCQHPGRGTNPVLARILAREGPASQALQRSSRRDGVVPGVQLCGHTRWPRSIHPRDRLGRCTPQQCGVTHRAPHQQRLVAERSTEPMTAGKLAPARHRTSLQPLV